MIKVSFSILVLLAAHLTVFAASVSAQTGDLLSKNQGINSSDDGRIDWSGLTGHIGSEAEVRFSNSYSGSPSDPPNKFEIHIELRNQGGVFFDGGKVASVTLAFNTQATITGYEQFSIGLLNGAGITKVTGKLEAKKVNTPSGYSVYVTDSSAFYWHN